MIALAGAADLNCTARIKMIGKWKETNDLLNLNFTLCGMFCLSFLRLAPMSIAASLPLCE